jgi:hypothetical protein
MDDEERARHERLLKEQDTLRKALEESRKRVGVEPDDLRRVVEVALARAAFPLSQAKGESAGVVETFRFDPVHPAFAAEPGWADAFDDLRARPRRRGERLNEWRKDAAVRSIAFETPELADGRLASDVVQVHLEHRLVRRLLSRFLSQGFQSKLSRVSVIRGPGAQPRVILMGRLSLFGAAAARLHEEIIPVTAVWTEAERDRKPLRPLRESGGATTLNQLEHALRDAMPAPAMAVARVQPLIEKDVLDLRPTLERISNERLADARALLAKRGAEEAKALTDLLTGQRARITKKLADVEHDNGQLALGFLDEERRELALDRKSWAKKLIDLERQLGSEPERIQRSYDVVAYRLEPVGLVYLWPETG